MYSINNSEGDDGVRTSLRDPIGLGPSMPSRFSLRESSLIPCTAIDIPSPPSTSSSSSSPITLPPSPPFPLYSYDETPPPSPPDDSLSSDESLFGDTSSSSSAPQVPHSTIDYSLREHSPLSYSDATPLPHLSSSCSTLSPQHLTATPQKLLSVAPEELSDKLTPSALQACNETSFITSSPQKQVSNSNSLHCEISCDSGLQNSKSPSAATGRKSLFSLPLVSNISKLLRKSQTFERQNLLPPGHETHLLPTFKKVSPVPHPKSESTAISTHLESSSTSSPLEKCRGKWVRPLGYAERFMSAAHEYGCMTTVYALWLDSKRNIPFTLIKQAASIMYRKMPHLRLALGRYHGDLWWREMENETMDIQELDTDDIVATAEELLKRRYQMEEGPLWFTRFVTVLSNDQHKADTHQNHEFSYVCIFGFHHNVSDGTTNMKFCKVFLEVLNKMLQGKDVEVSVEGSFAYPLHDRLADIAATRRRLLEIFLSRFYKGILSYGGFVKNFTRHYRMPTHTQAATRVLFHELDEPATEKLLQRCKVEEVTLNSTFIAAANLALYKMMITKDSSVKTAVINSLQAINMRRYWPQELQNDTFGCHISMLDFSIPANRENFERFWDYVRIVHSSLRLQLEKTRLPLIVMPISERLQILICSNSFLNRLRLPSMNDNHYCVTNMGDLAAAFPGTGPEVEVKRLLRTASCHLMSYLCQHTIQTFRGRFSYSLDYYTQKMSKETASAYSQCILDLLKTCVESPV